MTNEEAIEYLKNINDRYPCSLDTTFQDECEMIAINLAIKALEENAALNLLSDWAIQCNFGYDNFPEEYEKYADEMKNLGYKEGMIYLARKEVNHD